jgi:cold shock CspA family protein
MSEIAVQIAPAYLLGTFATSKFIAAFGLVVSLNAGFGFIQPYLQTSQVYYNQRDAPPAPLALMQEVSFIEGNGTKGPCATAVMPIREDLKLSKAGVKGVVKSLHDTSTCSLVLIEPLDGQGLPRSTLVVYSVPSAGGKRRSDLCANGDEVVFDLQYIPDTSYARAIRVEVVRSAADRRRAERIAELERLGAKKEQGIVDTINRGGEYGFIKCADRPGSIYMRLSDAADKEACTPGAEVEFYVLDEPGSGKGPGKTFACNVTSLPKGSVEFETTLFKDARAVVIREAITYPEEVPGLVRVVDANIDPAARVVELWPRCLPDGLILKKGDHIMINVIRYRPEKLIFVRSCRLVSYRSLGREQGVIVRINRRDTGGPSSGANFGFLKPSNRDDDLFFKLSDVMASNGSFLPDNQIISGMSVSYEVQMDDSKNSNGRAKATRLCIEPFIGAQPSSVEVETTTATAGNSRKKPVTSGSHVIISSGVTGKMLRPSRKEVAGLVQITSDVSHVLGADPSDLVYKSVIDSIREFEQVPEWNETCVEHTTPTYRKLIQRLLLTKFEGIGCEVVEGVEKSSEFRNLKLFKLNNELYLAWKTSNLSVVPSQDSEASKGKSKTSKKASRTSAPLGPSEFDVSAPRSPDEPLYAALAYSDFAACPHNLDKGVLMRFDLCVDLHSRLFCVQNIVVTDDPVPEDNGVSLWRMGKVEYVKHMKGGFIRCFPSDERLLWETSSVLPAFNEGETSGAKQPSATVLWNKYAAFLVPGCLVAFQIRLRGGRRSAAGLHAIPEKYQTGTAVSPSPPLVAPTLPDAFYETQLVEEIAAGEVIAVVVDQGQAIIVDASKCPALSKKYCDINDPLVRMWLSYKTPKYLGIVTEAEKKSFAKQSGSSSDWRRGPAESGEAGSAVDAAVEEGGDGASEGSGSEVQLWPPLPFAPVRLAIPAGAEVKIGDLVVCSATIHQSVQRAPICLTMTKPFSASSGGMYPTIMGSADSSSPSLPRVGVVRRVLDTSFVASGCITSPKFPKHGEAWAEIGVDKVPGVINDSEASLAGVFLFDMRAAKTRRDEEDVDGNKTGNSSLADEKDRDVTPNVAEGDIVSFIPVVINLSGDLEDKLCYGIATALKRLKTRERVHQEKMQLRKAAAPVGSDARHRGEDATSGASAHTGAGATLGGGEGRAASGLIVMAQVTCSHLTCSVENPF